MNDDLLIIQLRDCFTAGYTLPQFCRDLNIKKPLFVAIDERRADFLWEIFVQFKYDKRITPKFALLNGKVGTLNFSVAGNLPELGFERQINLNEYDAIIFLSAGRFNAPIPKIIYLDQLTNYFKNRAYAEIPLLHFLQRNPKVRIIVTTCPWLSLNEYTTEFEKDVSKGTMTGLRDKLKANDGKSIKTPLDFLGYTNKEVLNLIEITDAKTNRDGSTVLEDSDNTFMKIKFGKRTTAYQPVNFKNKICFMGACTYVGIGAPFDKTLESYLQKILNDNNLPYRVENEAQFFVGRYQDIFYNLNALDLKPYDIVFICLQGLRPATIPVLDLSNVFDRPHNYGEVFFDRAHINEIGYKILAEKFFNFLIQHNFFKDAQFNYPAPPPPRSSLRHSERKLSIPCNKTFRQRRIGGTQKNFARTAA